MKNSTATQKKTETKNLFTEAEAQRNTLLLTFYGLESQIKAAKTTADYVDLIRRTGMLAEAMANVLTKMAANNETLKPVDDKNIDWIKKM